MLDLYLSDNTLLAFSLSTEKAEALSVFVFPSSEMDTVTVSVMYRVN